MPTRHGEITPFDHGPYVVVTAYITIVTAILFVLTRLITKALATRSLKLDDCLIIGATVNQPINIVCCRPRSQLIHVRSKLLAIVQTALVHAAEHRGLGRHRSSLTPSEFDQYSKVGAISLFKHHEGVEAHLR